MAAPTAIWASTLRTIAQTLRIPVDTSASSSPGYINFSDIKTGLYSTLGDGITIKEGTNARSGTATLAAGTVTIPNTSITTTTRVHAFIDSGTQTNAGTIRCSTRTAGTSFTIVSSNGADTSGFSWFLIEPSP